MRKLYVIDTNGIISFYKNIFKDALNYKGSPALSPKTESIINHAIVSQSTNIRLSIPSVVFIEIYDKWLNTEEFTQKFYFEVFIPLKQSLNVEIRPIDREILENLIQIEDNLKNHDLHDKLILSTAITLEAPLITIDTAIIEYVQNQKTVPETIW